jgi:hypothetical protein
MNGQLSRLKSLSLVALCAAFFSASAELSAQTVTMENALLVGAGLDGNPHVIARATDESTNRDSFFAFAQAFRGGVSVAGGDVNGDGIEDIIVGAGPGAGPHVRIFNGKDLSQMANYYAYDSAFKGGIVVASGDVDGDGDDDVITGAGAGGGPHVKVFEGDSSDVLESFFAFDPGFHGGITVGSVDIDGDNKDDVIVGAGPGAGPHVKVFRGTDKTLLRSFYAFDEDFRGGVFVAGGYVNSDDNGDIIVGAGPGAGPHVAIFDGASSQVLESFYAFAPAFRGGVRVGATDRDETGSTQIIAGAGNGGDSHVAVFQVGEVKQKALKDFYSFPGYDGPVSVSGFSVPVSTTQCNDGVDNDKDGAIDLKDFSCGNNPSHNDESTPKAQCQDGIDNDNDGLIDLKDPGCGGDPNHNDESTKAAECQDKIDNDKDGAIDLEDFSCGGIPTHDDESTPKSQCQDGIDNDGNGLIDLNDPSCTNAQDNFEGNGETSLALVAECITENTNGTRTAYFTYNNRSGAAVSTDVENFYTPTIIEAKPVKTFKVGVCKGCSSATFSGASVTWTVTTGTTGTSAATATTDTAKCAPVAPLLSCQGYQDGKIRVKSGWNNPNPFTMYIPIGTLNTFAPGGDVGQPVEFLSGNIPGAFDVTLARNESATSWSLNGSQVSSKGAPVCAGECLDTATGAITGQLNEIAQQLADLTRKAAKNLEAAASDEAVDADRARRDAAQYEQEAMTLTLQFPAVIKNCPEAPLFCETVDRGPTIAALQGLYAQERNTVKRVQSRAYFRKTGKTNRNDALIKKAVTLEQQGLAELAKLPRFATECK